MGPASASWEAWVNNGIRAGNHKVKSDALWATDRKTLHLAWALKQLKDKTWTI